MQDNHGGGHERRDTLHIESSTFGNNEGKWAKGWIMYTILYWTVLTWTPIIRFLSFSVNSAGLVFYIVGSILMISAAYLISTGEYPSGANANDFSATNGKCRITAALLTVVIIIDCYVLLYVSANNFDDTIIYNINFLRLIFHILYLFWTSLFFYNKFRKNNPEMAKYAFITKWFDIVLLCVVSYSIIQPKSLNLVYVSIIGIKLVGWMFPMMFIKKWGSSKYSKTVSVHLLLLDLCTDVPVIIAVLASGGYKQKRNGILWLDIIWKSVMITRSTSLYLIKHRVLDYIFKTQEDEEKDQEKDEEKDEEKEEHPRQINVVDVEALESEEAIGIIKLSSFCWLFYVFLYWSVSVWIKCGLDNEIARNHEYYFWCMGLIGIFTAVDYISDIKRKEFRSSIAWISLFVSIDLIGQTSRLLLNSNSNSTIGVVVIVFHCLALSSSAIFYRSLFTKGIKYTYVIQWIDVILMVIVMQILHDQLKDSCFSFSLCVGYFSFFSIKIIGLYIPVIFGYYAHPYIHLHMLLLNTVTDGSLVIIAYVSKGYRISPFIFFDVVCKIVIIIFSFSYHLVINFLLKKQESDNGVADNQSVKKINNVVYIK